MIDHHQAQRLLNDEAFKEAVVEIRRDIADEWQRSRPDDAAGRENLFRQLQAVDRLTAKLESYVLNGRMAERQNPRA